MCVCVCVFCGGCYRKDLTLTLARVEFTKPDVFVLQKLLVTGGSRRQRGTVDTQLPEEPQEAVNSHFSQNSLQTASVCEFLAGQIFHTAAPSCMCACVCGFTCHFAVRVSQFFISGGCPRDCVCGGREESSFAELLPDDDQQQGRENSSVLQNIASWFNYM